jgi:MFS family permease
MIGSAIEWYDFYVYGTSIVLILGPLFFPAAEPLTGTLLAFSTFAIGFLARPLGAIVLAHVGDRVGRTRALVLSLLLMGCATVGVGLLPTYAEIGALAPVLLVTLRLLQGFAVGGEWGGAALLAVEHAPQRRRTLYGSLPQFGTPIGLLFSSIAILLAGLIPDEAFRSWGWRLPFLASMPLVLVGLYIRIRIEDSDEFRGAHSVRAQRRLPLMEILRHHRRAVVVGTSATLVCHAAYIISSFLPSYATTALQTSDRTALVALCVAGVGGIGALAAVGWWSGARDRRPLAVVGAGLSALWVFPAFQLAGSAGGPGLVVAVTVGLGVLMLQYAVLPALLADQFPVEVRYTGVSLCFQLSAVVGGGLVPLLASALVSHLDHYAPAALLLVVAGAVSAAGSLTCAPPDAAADQLSSRCDPSGRTGHGGDVPPPASSH